MCDGCIDAQTDIYWARVEVRADEHQEKSFFMCLKHFVLETIDKCSIFMALCKESLITSFLFCAAHHTMDLAACLVDTFRYINC